jgi:hypothetical protein
MHHHPGEAETVAYEARLEQPVGDGRPNAEQDVRWLVRSLVDLGRWPRADADQRYACCRLRDAVQRYQHDRGLRCDGLLNPGGETERTMVVELSCIGPEEGR